MQAEHIHGGKLARNTAFNLAGSVLPACVALIVTPYVIHGLGVERFGVLSLVWAILWYASNFDLGLTRATTKFVAEAFGKGQTETIPAILWTSLGIQCLLGTIATVSICFATPLLVHRVLHIPPALARESQLAFYGISATIPFFLGAGILSALLAGAHRFDLVNIVKIPANSSMFLLPALGVYLGYRLPGVVLLLFVSRVLISLVLFRLCWKAFPNLGNWRGLDVGVTKPLLKFGGWVMACNVLIPVLIYIDRFVIGAIVSVAAVAYYSLAYEVVSRLQIVPSSISNAVFPALSSLSVDNRERMNRLYARSLKTVLLLVIPTAALLVLFAHEGLRIWVGADFADHSAPTLQILAVGLALNALSQIPANLLDAVARPDLRAKVFAAYLLPYLIALWLLVHYFGILGAAIAWAARGAVELSLFLFLAARLLRLPGITLATNGMTRAILACGGLAASLFLLRLQGIAGIMTQGIIAAFALAAFVAITWLFVFDGTDRQSLLTAIGGQK
jgi:O-antigen/teichoic acid export membrane protein